MKDGLTIAISKKDKKIRQFGINDSEIYQIVNNLSCRLTIF